MIKGNSTWEPYVFEAPSNLPLNNNPTILAFSCYFHDSSACILKNGKIIAAAEEERFSRKKHDPSFPKMAIEYCLQEAGEKSIDIVVFYENPDKKWRRIEEAIIKNPPLPETKKIIYEIWETTKNKNKLQETFFSEIGLNNQIIFLDHHLCHAASSFYMSGFDKSAIVTIDGVGEKATTSYGIGIGNAIQLLENINFPNSIGLLYTALTVYLGFKANDHEYKVMGLAPYGIMDPRANPFYLKLKRVINLNPDGSFFLNMKYFGHAHFETPAYTPSLIELLGVPPRLRDDSITSDHKNLAAALQIITEESVFNLLNAVQQKTKTENLCLSGGVALNSVLNGKILSHTPFKHIFIQPAAGDSGTVIGAAKYIYHNMNKTSPLEHMSHSYYGPKYSAEEVHWFLENHSIKYRKFETEKDLIDETAILLNNKAVIGWFQGRMEWGPRALGNRSILASPLFHDMQDLLNEKVKHRELFRPFAPVICVDDAEKYYHCDLPIPEPTDFMLMVYPTRHDKQSQIPAVTHVDGSGRLQTIREKQNPLYYHLIKRFGELSGVPILINTSFNIRGEPIVCSPEDAYRCMMGTEIDYLVIDHFIVKRLDNLKDCWEPKIDD